MTLVSWIKRWWNPHSGNRCAKDLEDMGHMRNRCQKALEGLYGSMGCSSTYRQRIHPMPLSNRRIQEIRRVYASRTRKYTTHNPGELLHAALLTVLSPSVRIVFGLYRTSFPSHEEAAQEERRMYEKGVRFMRGVLQERPVESTTMA